MENCEVNRVTREGAKEILFELMKEAGAHVLKETIIEFAYYAFKINPCETKAEVHIGVNLKGVKNGTPIVGIIIPSTGDTFLAKIIKDDVVSYNRQISETIVEREFNDNYVFFKKIYDTFEDDLNVIKIFGE